MRWARFGYPYGRPAPKTPRNRLKTDLGRVRFPEKGAYWALARALRRFPAARGGITRQ